MYAVVKHRTDGTDWIAEVLPVVEEAAEWAQIFRDREAKPGVTYTVEPLEEVMEP
jgi:hypothetical protein